MSGWGKASGLGLLAAGGQAAALLLIDAPPYAAYQHYADWNQLPARSALALGVLVVQAVTCGILAAGHRDVLRGRMRQLLGWRGLAALGLLTLAAAVPTESVPRFAREAGLALAIAAIAALNLWLAIRAIPAAAFERLSGWVDRRVTLGEGDASPARWDRALPWAAGAWVVLLSAALGFAVFEQLPHIDDSVSYLFQAKYFATGHLTLPAPPDSAAFQMDQTIMDRGRWFAYGFPGWPALLALGVLAGVPWLVNPLLGGLCVLLAHQVVRRSHGRGVANLTCLLMAVSPWFLFMSGEFLGHQAALLWLLLTMLGVQIERERRSGLGALTAGLSLGMLCLTRPLDGVIAAVALAPWVLGFAGAPRLPVRSLALGAFGITAMGLLGLGYNARVTGSLLSTPHRLWMDRAWGTGTDRLGFGADVGNRAWPNVDPLPGHGVADILLNFNKNLFQTNVDLLGWSFGSLVFALVFLLSRHRRPADRYLISLAIAFPAGYSAYWFSGGPDHGARYWYLVLVPLLVLTARGLAAIARSDRAGPEIRPGAVALLASGIAMTVFVPWRAATKYYRYRGVSGEVRRMAQRYPFGNALVFVRSQDPPDYQSAFNLNPADLGAAVPVYARATDSASMARVIAAFPDRTIWVIGRSGQGGGFEVLSGPHPPGARPP